MFALRGVDLYNAEALYILQSNAILLPIALLGAVPLARTLYARYAERGIVKTLAVPAFSVVVLTVSIAYLVDSSFNPFLYFRF